MKTLVLSTPRPGPFHVAIAKTLSVCADYEVEILGTFICNKYITHHHDEILAVWEARAKKANLPLEQISRVSETILSQKSLAQHLQVRWSKSGGNQSVKIFSKG
jgi:hypothetical protein